MSGQIGKIVLKSSTSKSLSDRFGELARTSIAENVRQRKRTEHVASTKNKRLAASMAKRLGHNDNTAIELTSRKTPIKKRLGLSMENRLGTRRGRGNTRVMRGVSSRGIGTRSRGLARGQIGRGGRSAFKSPAVKRGGSVARRGVTRGSRGRGRGRGARGGAGAGKNVTQAQLDQELDTYMSKTKSALDAQLDQYMSFGDK